MRVLSTAKVLGGLLLFSALTIGSKLVGQEWSSDEDFGQVKAADCSYKRNPDRYVNGLRRAIEELSRRTEAVTRERTGVQYSRSHNFAFGPPSSEIESRGYVDSHLFGKMEQDGVPHAPLCSDLEFIRRVYLDLTGRIPHSQEIRGFLESTHPNKRRNLIRQILFPAGSRGGKLDSAEIQTPLESAFIDKWTMFYGDLLRNTAFDSNVQRYIEGRNAFYELIKEFVATEMPYDIFVKRLITGSGDNQAVGEANWALGGITPMGPIQDTYDTLAARTTEQFLGLSQFDCLLCHAGAGKMDKLNVWGTSVERREAWEMAAFFSRTQIRRTTVSQNPLKYAWTVTDLQNGDYRLNTTAGNRPPRQPFGQGDIVKPKYIFSSTPVTGGNYRTALAENLVRDRQFARATVNYLWKQMMGMGIVEPADQFDPARLDPANTPDGWGLQPSHPELLEALTDDFLASGYNIRKILFEIADSSAYQLSSSFPGEWRIEYTPYFARKYVRRMWAEEVHDAISQATGVKGSYAIQGFLSPVQWAMQFPDTQEPLRSSGAVNAFLNYFLRGNRDQNLRSDDGTILQALNLMNNQFVLSRIRNSNKDSTVYKLLSNSELKDAQVVEELFLSTLGRFPTRQELSLGLAALKASRVAGTEDLQWALLNKVDFLYNY